MAVMSFLQPFLLPAFIYLLVCSHPEAYSQSVKCQSPRMDITIDATPPQSDVVAGTVLLLHCRVPNWIASQSNPTFQWFNGKASITGGNGFIHADTANLTISAVSPANIGDYNCVVNGVYCATKIRSVNVLATVFFLERPSDARQYLRKTISFQARVEYQGGEVWVTWNFERRPLRNGVHYIRGSKTLFYNISSLSFENGGRYSLVVKPFKKSLPAVFSNFTAVVIGPPSEPNSGSCMDRPATSLSVKWSSPTEGENQDELVSYLLTYGKEGDEKAKTMQIPAYQRSAELKDLDACSKYNATIQSIGKHLKSSLLKINCGKTGLSKLNAKSLFRSSHDSTIYLHLNGKSLPICLSSESLIVLLNYPKPILCPVLKSMESASVNVTSSSYFAIELRDSAALNQPQDLIKACPSTDVETDHCSSQRIFTAVRFCKENPTDTLSEEQSAVPITTKVLPGNSSQTDWPKIASFAISGILLVVVGCLTRRLRYMRPCRKTKTNNNNTRTLQERYQVEEQRHIEVLDLLESIAKLLKDDRQLNSTFQASVKEYIAGLNSFSDSFGDLENRQETVEGILKEERVFMENALERLRNQLRELSQTVNDTNIRQAITTKIQTFDRRQQELEKAKSLSSQKNLDYINLKVDTNVSGNSPAVEGGCGHNSEELVASVYNHLRKRGELRCRFESQQQIENPRDAFLKSSELVTKL
eukprot:m.271217 g.271217  ORF g.271217 m.271217 type:complete len:702 (+) comp40549_c0_seq24:48-2153(+)